MDFKITLIGLNHRTATVDIREKFALGEYCSSQNWLLPCHNGLEESFILSTCNRVELLGVSRNSIAEHIIEMWAKTCNMSVSELKSYIYVYHNMDAVKHLFEVASSLDSMVLGEPQILGQIKSAYRKSVQAGAAGAIINRLMHKAFFAAKRVRNETAVASNAVSISYAAVELAKRIFGSLPTRRAMLIGAGEMAELAALHLIEAGIDEIQVLNRTFSHGEELAARIHGKAAPFEELNSCLKQSDIIIASTGSKEPVVHAADVKSALKIRKNSPMFFIDIAVPRDIDPEVNELDNVYLYDIDDLKEVVEENRHNRKEEAVKAKAIIEEESEQFAIWLDNLKVQPTILDLLRMSETVAQSETARAIRKLGDASPQTVKILEEMALRITKKLIHHPLMYLKNAEIDHVRSEERIDRTRRMFDLDEIHGHH